MAKAALLFVGTDDGLVLLSDPGASGRWLRVGHELRGTPIHAVWPLYNEPQIVLAGGPHGLWRSGDGGATWQQLGDQAVTAFVGERSTPLAIELATEQTRWQHSSDGGASWQVGDGTSISVPDQLRAELGGQQPVLLAARGAQIERSEDHGATWQATTTDEPFGGEVTIISPSRYHIDTALAGSRSGQLVISTDRGRSWQIVKRDLPVPRAIVATRLA